MRPTGLAFEVVALLLGTAALSTSGTPMRIHVSVGQTANSSCAPRWAGALTEQLAGHPAEFSVVRNALEADLKIRVGSCEIYSRPDDQVRVWHVKGVINTSDGYAAPLTLSYEEPNAEAVLRHYVESLPDVAALARRQGRTKADPR